MGQAKHLILSKLATQSFEKTEQDVFLRSNFRTAELYEMAENVIARKTVSEVANKDDNTMPLKE